MLGSVSKASNVSFIKLSWVYSRSLILVIVLAIFSRISEMLFSCSKDLVLEIDFLRTHMPTLVSGLHSTTKR